MYKLHLDYTEVVFKNVINDSKIVITRSLLINLMKTLGSVCVFAVSFIIVAGLLTKLSLIVLTKYRYITGGGIGTTVFYRIACINVPFQPTGDAIIKTGSILVNLENS